MPHTFTNGIVTFYDDAGEGPVVVLIHGHSLDSRMWRYQVPALIQAGFRAVRHDVRGHGRSMIPPTGYTWDDYAADLRDLLDRLNVERAASEALDVAQVHIVGLSMGGGIALQFALDYPERVLSLTLVDSTLTSFGYSQEFTATIGALREAVQREGVRPAFERLWLTHAMFDGVRQQPERFALVREMVGDFQAPEYVSDLSTPGYKQPAIAERLGEIAAPALVVVGEADLPDFRLIAEILASNLRNARLLTMPRCHHLPPLESPDEFNAALTEFLIASTGRGR